MSQTDNFFSPDELSEMTLDELKSVADYLGIVYSKNVKKASLIAALHEKYMETNPPPAVADVPVTMSERVKRIQDRLNGGN